jgi:hypothetical protein
LESRRGSYLVPSRVGSHSAANSVLFKLFKVELIEGQREEKDSMILSQEHNKNCGKELALTLALALALALALKCHKW